MNSSEGGLLVKGVRLGATRAPIYENRDRDDLVLMGFDEGTVGAVHYDQSIMRCTCPCVESEPRYDRIGSLSGY